MCLVGTPYRPWMFRLLCRRRADALIRSPRPRIRRASFGWRHGHGPVLAFAQAPHPPAGGALVARPRLPGHVDKEAQAVPAHWAAGSRRQWASPVNPETSTLSGSPLL